MRFTIYEVMNKGEVILAVDRQYEHVVSWNRSHILNLWMETNGVFQMIESRTLSRVPVTVDQAVASANKLLLNVDEKVAEVITFGKPLNSKRF